MVLPKFHESVLGSALLLREKKVKSTSGHRVPPRRLVAAHSPPSYKMSAVVCEVRAGQPYREANLHDLMLLLGG